MRRVWCLPGAENAAAGAAGLTKQPSIHQGGRVNEHPSPPSASASALARTPHRWQAAKQQADDLLAELPATAPGTHVYIATDGLDHPTLVALRAYVRAAARAGEKVRLL
jgi:hypothetical protein